MKRLILFILIFGSMPAFAQVWYHAGDTIKLPKSGFYNNSGYLKKHDTVPCFYVLKGDDSIRRGFKIMRISHGFYIDDSSTLYSFFDDSHQPINNVRKYSY